MKLIGPTSKSFKALIDMYPESYVIGLTATPIRGDGKGLGDVYEELVECGSIKGLQEQGFFSQNKIFCTEHTRFKRYKSCAEGIMM